MQRWRQSGFYPALNAEFPEAAGAAGKAIFILRVPEHFDRPVHLQHHAALIIREQQACLPVDQDKYAIDRFAMEVKRQFDVLDRHLATHRYLAGDEYSIADMAVWPWYGAVSQNDIYGESGTFLETGSYQHFQRWRAEIATRPAVQRGRMVNRRIGKQSEQLHERHHASDFETRTQDKIAAEGRHSMPPAAR